MFSNLYFSSDLYLVRISSILEIDWIGFCLKYICQFISLSEHRAAPIKAV
ncbi:hypothetical protein DAI22_11g105500 [Oryza sativa Japonica Group]|nr:hypothetical protein DAI22_11g105500 [Oryza sativa Japonica Group]